MNNNVQYQPPSINIGEQILKYYYKALKYWYLFIIAFIVAFVYYKYKKKFEYTLYSINTTVLVNTQTSNPERIAGGIIFDNRSNLDNEIARLRSYNYMLKVIKMAKLRTFYFLDNPIGYDPELYKNSPFIVEEIDKYRNYIEEKIKLEIIDDNSFEINLPYTKENIKKKFGDTIDNQLFSFIIHKNQNLFNKQHIGKKFYFIFRDSISLAQELFYSINIKPYTEQSSLLWIWIVDKNIDKNIDILNTLTDVYQKESINRKNFTAQKTIDFIDSMLYIFNDSLQNVENVLQYFKIQNKIDISNEGKNLFDVLSDFDNKKKELLLKRQFYEIIMQEVNNSKELSISSPSILGFNDAILERLLEKYTQLYIDIKIFNLSVNPTSEIAPYKQKKLELENIKSSIARHINEVLKYTKYQIDEINKNIKEIEQKLNLLPITERKYIQLTRRFNLNNQIYTMLLQRRMEANITLASNSSDVEIIDIASRANIQYKGTTGGISFLKALALTMVIAISIMVFLELIKLRIENLADVENNIRIPILGTISYNYKNTNLPTQHYSNASITETFRSLRTNISYFITNKKGNIIVVSSMISGEGKSFVAANLASIFAISNKKTIVVGFDLRKPRLEEIFVEHKHQKGFVDWFMDEANLDEIIIQTKYNNLFLILSGTIPPYPAEILDSSKTKEFITLLSEKFDFIIIDTPPVGIVTDALLIAPLATIFLYVVRENYSYKNTTKIINQIVEERGINNAGIVYNGLKQERHYGKYHNYGYGYYKGHGYYEQDNIKSSFWQRISKFFKKFLKLKNTK